MSNIRRTKSVVLIVDTSCHIIKRTISCPNFTHTEEKIIEEFPEFHLEEETEIPRLAIWTLIDERETDTLVNTDKDEALQLLSSILESKGLTGLNFDFMRVFLFEILHWALEKDFNLKKISCLLGLLYNTHKYFLTSPDKTHQDVYSFCRESIVLHSIEYPPKAERVLGAFESRDCLKYFCETYLPMIPLLRMSLLPNYRLEVNWNALSKLDTPHPSNNHHKKKSLKT